MTTLCHYVESCNADSQVIFTVMLSVIMRKVIMRRVIMLNVIMLNVIMLSVLATTQHKWLICNTQHKEHSALQHCTIMLSENHYAKCRYAQCCYDECRRGR